LRYNAFHSALFNRTGRSLAQQGLAPVHEALFPTFASPAAKGRGSEDHTGDFSGDEVRRIEVEENFY
jgi:hypothetical protein